MSLRSVGSVVVPSRPYPHVLTRPTCESLSIYLNSVKRTLQRKRDVSQTEGCRTEDSIGTLRTLDRKKGSFASTDSGSPEYGGLYKSTREVYPFYTVVLCLKTEKKIRVQWIPTKID